MCKIYQFRGIHGRLLIKPGLENQTLSAFWHQYASGAIPAVTSPIDHAHRVSTICELVLSGEGVLIRDCGSTNGRSSMAIRSGSGRFRPDGEFGRRGLFIESPRSTLRSPNVMSASVPNAVVLEGGRDPLPAPSAMPVIYKCTHCNEVMCKSASCVATKGGLRCSLHGLQPQCERIEAVKQEKGKKRSSVFCGIPSKSGSGPR